MITIRNRYNNEVIFEADVKTMKECLAAAIKAKANLHPADLSSANLRYANLSFADLSSADLSSADLSYANLRYADLRYTNLGSANLRYVNLGYADLRSANLRYADLRYANLGYADLRSANLRSAKNAEYAIAVTRILPEGTIIGWKKCKNDVIVKLEIPMDAKRSSAFGRKCRCEYAEVIDVIGGDEGVSKESNYGGAIVYRKGSTVKCHEWDENWTEECAGGIHFFITRPEAEQY